MHWFVYVPFLCSLLASPAARRAAQRLSPNLATWALTASGLLLAASTTLALGLLACAGLFRVRQLALEGRWSIIVIDRARLDPGLVAAIAGLMASVGILAATRLLVRRVMTLRRAAAEASGMPGSTKVVIVDSQVPEAFSLPGRPGRIVVSAGMLAALDRRERQVLLAHEEAHLTHRHHIFVAVAQCAAAANPLLRPLSFVVEFTVERWADESAATAARSDRRLVARAVTKAALATRQEGGGPASPASSSFGLGFLGLSRSSTAAGPGPVPRRVAALLAPPLRGGTHLFVALMAIALLSLLSAAEASRDLINLLELARSAAGRS